MLGAQSARSSASWWRRCGGASAGATRRCRRRGGRGNTTRAIQPGSQRKLHCRRPRDGGPEQVLLDENALARGRRAFSVAEIAVSPDHKLLAYSVDEDGSERNTLKVRDLATGRDLADTIAEVRGGAVWSTRQPMAVLCGARPGKWGQKVFRHRLGTPTAEDQLVYEEKEEGFSVSLRVTLSDRFLVIEAATSRPRDVQVARSRPSDRAAAGRRRAQARDTSMWSPTSAIA